VDLDKLVTLCIKIDNRQYSRRMEKLSASPSGSHQQPKHFNKPVHPNPTKSSERTTYQTPPHDGLAPMQLDAVLPTFGPLSKEEKQRRMNLGLCLYCGNPGHLAKSCQKKPALNGKVQGQ
jgi:hypothetical protein